MNEADGGGGTYTVFEMGRERNSIEYRQHLGQPMPDAHSDTRGAATSV